MKALFIICLIAMLVIIVANIIWDVALTERERKYKLDLEVLRKNNADYHNRLAMQNAKESRLKKWEADLDLMDKNIGIQQEVIAKRAEELAKKAKELEATAGALVQNVPDVVEPADEPKPVKKAKKGGKK